MEPTKPGGSFELVTVRQSHPDAVAMLEEYADYLASSVPGGFDCATDPRVPPGAFDAPHGRFLVAYDSTPTGGEPLGCGALRLLEPGVAEVRKMWVVPIARGLGIGRATLESLESHAVELGCHTVRLDSMRALRSAVALYRSRGYEEIPDYNSNPNADIWMQRRIDAGPHPG